MLYYIYTFEMDPDLTNGLSVGGLSVGIIKTLWI
jgi:hypothetical protein